MLAKLVSSLRSKKGFAGALVLFYATVHGIFGLVQDATYAASNWGSIVGFLTSGLGNLCVVVVGILLILWAVVTQQPETAPPQSAAPPDPTAGKEVQRLKARLQKAEQENERLKALLADPNATKRREDEMLRRRCLELAETLQKFELAHRRTEFNRSADPNETVARFVQRHKWKVDELRNELDERGWLTPQELDTLTFHADDYSHKISDMADALRSIGLNH